MKKLFKLVLGSIIALSLCLCGVACDKTCKHENVTKHEGKPAKCYETGIADYWQCNDCLRAFKDQALSQEYKQGETYPETLSMTAHDYGDGYICTNDGCSAEKPYTTEIAGHTYLVDNISLSTNIDWEELSPDVQTAVYGLMEETYASRHTGTHYIFGQDGSVGGVEVRYNVSTGQQFSNQVANTTYVQNGNTMTLSRVYNAGTADEEIASETYTLSDFGVWAQTIEASVSEFISPALNAPADLKVIGELRLIELNDHKLRHNENSFEFGYCDMCGTEIDNLFKVEGTTWKITSVTCGYNSELQPNQEFERFVENWFAPFINVSYTLNADGTVTGGANGWEQKGTLVTVNGIQTGIPTPAFSTFNSTFMLKSNTQMESITACILWSDSDLPSEIPNDYRGGGAWAVIHLTIQS